MLLIDIPLNLSTKTTFFTFPLFIYVKKMSRFFERDGIKILLFMF